MNRRNSLLSITVISLVGVIFSGVLTFQEFVFGACGVSLVKCSSTNLIMGLPACVYGLVMYLSVLAISLLGLRSKK